MNTLPKPCPGNVAYKEFPLEYVITAGETEYTFDKRLGVLSKIISAGNLITEKPVSFNFFRAPTDNDSQRWDWLKSHLHDYDTKIYSVGIEKSGANVVVSEDISLGWNVYRPFAKCRAVYTFYPGGEVGLDGKFEFSEKVSMLPRLGVRLTLPKKFDRVKYYGYGPHESYKDKHRASYIGLFESRVEDMYEPYIRPQENSSHCGCGFVEISDGKTALRFEGDGGISFNASEYTQEELWARRHDWELEKSKDIILCIDGDMAGVGSNSCGPELLEKYRLPLPKIELKLIMGIRRDEDV